MIEKAAVASDEVMADAQLIWEYPPATRAD